MSESKSIFPELYYTTLDGRKIILSEVMAMENMYFESCWSTACNICTEKFHIPEGLYAKDPYKENLEDTAKGKEVDRQLRILLTHKLKHIQQDLEKLGSVEK